MINIILKIKKLKRLAFRTIMDGSIKLMVGELKWKRVIHK